MVAAMMAPCAEKANGGNLGSQCFWEPVTACDRFSASASTLAHWLSLVRALEKQKARGYRAFC